MGAGAFAAGAGPAGHDPVPAPSAPTARRPDGAIMYDSASRGWQLDQGGQYEVVHFVDQKVALALSIGEGDLAPVSDFGNRFRRLSRLPRARLAAAADDAVRVALAQLLRDREIALLSVQVDTAVRGRLVVIVTYKNLLLPGSEARGLRLASP
jgi:hypothetical protein